MVSRLRHTKYEDIYIYIYIYIDGRPVLPSGKGTGWQPLGSGLKSRHRRFLSGRKTGGPSSSPLFLGEKKKTCPAFSSSQSFLGPSSGLFFGTYVAGNPTPCWPCRFLRAQPGSPAHKVGAAPDKESWWLPSHPTPSGGLV